MNIGIITVREMDYHPNGRLVEAAVQKGHRAVLVHPYHLWPKVTEKGLGFEGSPDILTLDVVLPRQGATIGNSSMTLIQHLSRMGVPLVNDVDAVRITSNQFMTLQNLAAAELPVPDTLFVNAKQGMLNAVSLLGGFPVVAKKVSSRQGAGTCLVEDKKQAESMFAEDIDTRTGILLQRFIPIPDRQDIRVLVVGKRVVGAMQLKPLPGDFRANYHLTRTSRPKKLTPAIEKIALEATRATGLDVAGVDLIVDRDDDMYVIEVNYSPGFKGLEKATGLDIAGLIIDYAVTKPRT